MLIIGAGGHAKEILEVLTDNGEEKFFFYDDLFSNTALKIFNQFPVLKNKKEVSGYFENTDKRFVLGLGGTKDRMLLKDKLCGLAGN